MIKGIDAQVMIQRSVEYARQAGDKVNSANQSQDFINRLERERSEKNVKTVTEASQAEQGRIKDDREKNGQQGGESPDKRKEKPTAEREILDDVSKLEVRYVPKSRLDIEV